MLREALGKSRGDRRFDRVDRTQELELVLKEGEFVDRFEKQNGERLFGVDQRD
jgi:hypothetical protein